MCIKFKQRLIWRERINKNEKFIEIAKFECTKNLLVHFSVSRCWKRLSKCYKRIGLSAVEQFAAPPVWHEIKKERCCQSCFPSNELCIQTHELNHVTVDSSSYTIVFFFQSEDKASAPFRPVALESLLYTSLLYIDLDISRLNYFHHERISTATFLSYQRLVQEMIFFS